MKKCKAIVCEVADCNNKIHAKNLCDKHYRRVLNTNSIELLPRKKKPSNQLRDIFLEKILVDKNNECWEWQDFRNKNGYGVTCVNSKVKSAHRTSYELFIGEIPKDLQINHKCHNRGCVNPDHLYAGTAKDNSRDMFEANRQRIVRGANHGNALLSEEQVILIREELINGARIAVLSKKFNISGSQISAIKLAQKWKSVCHYPILTRNFRSRGSNTNH